MSYVQSDILAAIALEQLKKIDIMNAKRDRIAQFYNNELKELLNIKIPYLKKDRTTNWHLYMIRVPARDRDFIIKALNAEGISSNIHYLPLHLHEYYKQLGYKEGQFPNAENYFNCAVRLPMYSSLRLEDAKDVAEAFKKVINSLGY